MLSIHTFAHYGYACFLRITIFSRQKLNNQRCRLMQANNKKGQISCLKHVFSVTKFSITTSKIKNVDEARLHHFLYVLSIEICVGIVYTYQEDESLFNLEEVSTSPQYDVHINNTIMEFALLKYGKQLFKTENTLFPFEKVEPYVINN